MAESTRRPARHVPEAAQFAAGRDGQEHDRQPGPDRCSRRTPVAAPRASDVRAGSRHRGSRRPLATALITTTDRSAPLRTHGDIFRLHPQPGDHRMANSMQKPTTQPLILELLARRNWFKPKQLEEIEETAPQGRGRHLARGGPDPGRPHLRTGDRQPLRRGPVSAGDPQQHRSRRGRQGGRQPSSPRSSARIG